MNYENYSKPQLARMLRQRDEDIRKIKEEDISWKIYNRMTEELEQERMLRLSYEDSASALFKEVRRYRILVGDEKYLETSQEN